MGLINVFKTTPPISLYLRVMLFAALGALGLGAVGFWRAGFTPWYESLYLALQLFLLRMPPLHGNTNFPLEVGRWTAAALSDFVILLTIYHVLAGDMRRLRLRWARGHVVVCGLGEVGIELVREFRKDKRKVVAIERALTTPGVAEAEQLGVMVIPGDAKSPETLHKARAEYAQYVLAVCAEDDTNIAIADAVRNLEFVPEGAMCLLLLTSPVLREMAVQQLAPEGNIGRCRIIDVPEIVARRTLEDYPLDFKGIRTDSLARVHLVVIGTGDLGFSLALKALQLCHFANRSRLLLTVVGRDAKAFLDRLEQKHPHAKPWYETQTLEHSPEDPLLLQKLATVSADNQFMTVAVCPRAGADYDAQSETNNVLLAKEIAKIYTASDIKANRPACFQVLVHLHRQAGFSTLLDSGKKPKVFASIHPFGLFETFCNRKTLLLEEQDAVAKALHKDFHEHHGGKLWGELSEEFRESNRLAADHVPIKLRAIGLCVVEQGKGETGDLEVFKTQIDASTPVSPKLPLLAEMEHARWCAERYLQGWSFGEPKDREERNRLKIHHDLVAWSNLDQKEKKKDWEQIYAIPTALATVGKMIASSSSCGPTSKPVT